MPQKPLVSQQPPGDRKLFLLLLLAGVALFTGVVASLSYQIVRQLLLEHIQAKAHLEVQQTIERLDDWLAKRQDQVDTIANTPIVRSMNWSVVQPYLIEEHERLEEFLSFVIAFPDGRFYSSRLGRTTSNIKDRDYFQKAMMGQPSISDPVTSRPSQEAISIIPVASPIRSKVKGKPIGVFTGVIVAKQIGQVMQQLKYGEGSYAFALNSKGEPIFHPDPKLRGTLENPAPSFLQSSDTNLAALARQMVNREEGMSLRQLDGEWKYVAYAPLKGVNWSVALIIPRQYIESPLNALNLLASILSVLFLIAGVGVWRQVQLLERSQSQVQLLAKQAEELNKALTELQQTQAHLVQSEKMSSLGQMVAGIAHEINNPISFIFGNLSYTQEYAEKLLLLVNTYKKLTSDLNSEARSLEEEIDIEFIQQDLPKLLSSMQSGAERIRQIVISLRNFSRLDEAEKKKADLHDGIESTLLLLSHRLPETIQVIKHYGDVPPIECYPSQINQVFMYLINNAIDAILGTEQPDPKIEIATQLMAEADQKRVRVAIADNGPGIPLDLRPKIFDPFFTTKPVGQGTGLGLAISYQIVVEVHQGNIWVEDSALGGAQFIVEFPAGF